MLKQAVLVFHFRISGPSLKHKNTAYFTMITHTHFSAKGIPRTNIVM